MKQKPLLVALTCLALSSTAFAQGGGGGGAGGGGAGAGGAGGAANAGSSGSGSTGSAATTGTSAAGNANSGVSNPSATHATPNKSTNYFNPGAPAANLATQNGQSGHFHLQQQWAARTGSSPDQSKHHIRSRGQFSKSDPSNRRSRAKHRCFRTPNCRSIGRCRQRARRRGRPCRKRSTDWHFRFWARITRAADWRKIDRLSYWSKITNARQAGGRFFVMTMKGVNCSPLREWT
jgi:hypothetical protein